MEAPVVVASPAKLLKEYSQLQQKGFLICRAVIRAFAKTEARQRYPNDVLTPPPNIQLAPRTARVRRVLPVKVSRQMYNQNE
ncbi:hypothetical protein GOP47_0031052 [Adiantum capillus-veneris]|nr:hypothetical protein GOP47_0031049 [Adiantum capillus-veneris]KAI5054056.1 hypothetical protein GOP47_0031052 [Adiantum capillus-veneris]